MGEQSSLNSFRYLGHLLIADKTVLESRRRILCGLVRTARARYLSCHFDLEYFLKLQGRPSNNKEIGRWTKQFATRFVAEIVR